MQVPLEISFRHVDKTDALEDLIREKAAKLEQICTHLISCRIAVESPQEHQQRGNPYRIRLDLKVPPGHEVVVKRESGKGDMHQGLPAVIRDAFNTARRRLQSLVEQQAGEVKSHPRQQTMAFVVKLFPEQGYGFLKTAEGREIYFHRHSVLHDAFDRLTVGTGVRFVEEGGEEGPQASTVHIVDKPGARSAASPESQPQSPDREE